MQTAAWSLMNSLGVFPAGRADAERRNRTCFSILLHSLLFLPASNLILEMWGGGGRLVVRGGGGGGGGVARGR